MLAFKFLKNSRLVTFNLKQLQPRNLLRTTSVPFVKKHESAETKFNVKFVQNFEPLIRTKLECKQIDKFEWELTNGREKSIEDLVSDFEMLSHHCAHTETCMSSDKFDDFFKIFVKKIQDFDDDQLMKVIKNLERFPQTDSTYSKNFHELWICLDEVCLERIKDWNQPILLKFCNLWMRLNLSRIGKFTGKALTKICRRIDRLPPKDLVEAMFYVTICRSAVVMADVESRFIKIFDHLDINEIGIMCLAFFKTETKVRSYVLIGKLYDKLIEDIDKVEDITLVNILKTLRYSSDPSQAPKMKALCNALMKKIDSYSLTACLHIAILGTNLQYCHQELLEAIVARYNKNIKQIRLKDIERLTFALGLLNFETTSGIEKEFLAKIIDELKLRVDEVVRHPKCLASTAHYLTTCGVHDIEIIKSVLSEKFVNFAYGRAYHRIGREILSLDSFARINLKGVYDGEELPLKIRKIISKHQTHYIPYMGQPYKLTHADKLLLDLQYMMEQKYGKNLLTHVLPHYQRPDIVYCFDENGNSVTEKIINLFPEPYSGKVITKEFILSQSSEFAQKTDQLQMVAVVLGGWNLYIRDSRKPTGGLQLKIEQLELVGYKTILIHFDDWLNQSLEAKVNLIENELRGILSKEKN